MNTPSLLFGLAAMSFVAYLAYATKQATAQPIAGRWVFPAALSVAFLMFSAYTVASEGPFGFLVEHTRTLWSSQIWFDLLLGVSVALWWMVPPARAVGMRIPLWMALVVATGNVGLLAMLARLWWLQDRTASESVNINLTGAKLRS